MFNRGILSGYMGKIDRVWLKLRRAQRLEPLWARQKHGVGMLLYYGRRYAEAIADSSKHLQLMRAPIMPGAIWHVYVSAVTNQLERAMTEFAQFVASPTGVSAILVRLGCAPWPSYGGARRVDVAEIVEGAVRTVL